MTMLRDLDIPLQFEPTECGIISVAAITKMLGKPLSPWLLKEKYGVSTRGLRASHLVRILRDQGFEANAALVGTDALQRHSTPVIALWKNNHFVVVASVSTKSATIFDPAVGWRKVRSKTFSRSLSGLIIEVTGVPRHASAVWRNRRGIRSWMHELKSSRALLGLFALSALLQATTLLVPAVAAKLIDVNSAGAGQNWIKSLGVFVTASLAALALRSAMQRLSINHSSIWSRRLLSSAVRRLLAKPVAYFMRNSPALLSSKVQSVSVIRSFVLRVVSSTLIQGISGVLSLAILFFISPLLGAAVSICRSVAVIVDSQAAAKVAAIGDERFSATASQNRLLVEVARSASTIKLNGAVEAVFRKFRRANALASNCEAAFDFARQNRSDLLSTLAAVEQISLLTCGAWLVHRGALTIGGLVEAGMYRELAVAGIRELQDAYAELLSVRVALRRTDDLEDPVSSTASGLPRATTGSSVALRNVSFAYSKFDPPVFDGLSLEIEPGECVAIIGPSGAGKSTLSYLVSGALAPTNGEVQIDGITLSPATESHLRSRIGTVLQNDFLITGTIAENISFFRKLEEGQVIEAAEAACIHQFIMSLPMKYETLISDEFQGISGGQRQRILIARALAGNPSLLVMDEATSFLDDETERAVSSRVAELSMTRLIFAHRKETISKAGRIVDLAALSTLALRK